MSRQQLCFLRAKFITEEVLRSGALYPLYHKLDSNQQAHVTFGELQQALPPIFSVPWTHIAERLLHKHVTKLHELSKEDKAAIAFMRVNK